MFKIAVCDDEKQFQRHIKELLTKYQNENGMKYEIDTFDSGKELVELGEEICQYKIVFLDINMDELDGMLTAKKIRELSKDVFIVFVTAFVKYSLKGYQVDAVRYILKDNETLPFCIYECMDAVLKKISNHKIWKQFNFTIGSRKIALDQILYIESRLHILEFHMMEEVSLLYTLYGTLNQMEQELSDSGFLRLHQSYLVNMKHIAEVRRYHALMKNGVRFDIPKARYKTAEARFCAYKGEI